MAGTVTHGVGVIDWHDMPVYLHRQPVDFRKSINGLSALVEQELKLSPFLNALFVFGCKRRNKIKVLYWDKTGFCLWYKRLEKDKFKWPRSMGDDVLLLDKEQFEWLLRGFDIQKMRPHRERFFENVA
jgi:transposase